MDQIKIGNFLKRLRKEKGITQEQMAESLNVSGRTVSRWETGTNMPDISILADIAEFYAVSIPEIIDGERKSETVNKEEKEIARTMSDYAATEKEKIFKEMRTQSIIGLCALVLYFVLQETGAYMNNDVLRTIMNYCETLVFVTVILMAAYTTGSLARLRSKRIKLSALENLPKPIRILVTVAAAVGLAVIIKKILVFLFGL